MTKFMPVFLYRKDKITAKSYMRWNAKIILRSSIILTAIGALSILLAFLTHYFDIKYLNEYHPVIYTFWLAPILSALILLSIFIKSAKHPAASVLFGPFGVYVVILFIVILTMLFFNKTMVSIYVPLVIFGFACLIIVISQTYMVNKIYLHMESWPKIEPAVNKKEWLKTSLRMMPGSFVFAALAAVSIIMLELLGSREGEVGKFSALIVITRFVFLFARGSAAILPPYISPAVKQGKMKNLQHIINKMLLIKLIPTILATIAIALYGKDILSYFGDFYVGAYPLLLILLIDMFISTITSSAIFLLMGGGYDVQYIRLNIFILLLIIALDIALIPQFEILGAIISLLIGTLAHSVISIIIVRKYLKIKMLGFV